MTTLSSFPFITINLLRPGNHCAVFRRGRFHCCKRAGTVRCNNNKGKEARNDSGSGGMPGNVVLKVAWYGSELLGVAASLLQSPAADRETEGGEGNTEMVCDESGAVERSVVVAAIKDDFLRSYFVTGSARSQLQYSLHP
ncbi:unnamed protein product [Cuscuta campestris]|uniref:Uncharacterized protein n=1 Tax=Cuscuta campestris TaxID=132261 RepID=A0A484N1F4_9ASTE|nr:unnamed protein product [Cuscuta campestris]